MKFKNLLRISFCIIVLLSLNSCNDHDEKILGTWQMTGIDDGCTYVETYTFFGKDNDNRFEHSYVPQDYSHIGFKVAGRWSTDIFGNLELYYDTKTLRPVYNYYVRDWAEDLNIKMYITTLKTRLNQQNNEMKESSIGLEFKDNQMILETLSGKEYYNKVSLPRIKTSKVGEKNKNISDEDDEIIGEVVYIDDMTDFDSIIEDSLVNIGAVEVSDPVDGTAESSYKVIVDLNGNIIGDYVGETSSEYIGMGQDEFRVSRSGHKVVEINRENGEGIVFCKEPGDIVKVYAQPSVNSPVIGKMIYEPGELPETYECIGKNGTWYKIRFNHKNGYVDVESVEWAAEDYF